jgi:hypothetical protein
MDGRVARRSSHHGQRQLLTLVGAGGRNSQDHRRSSHHGQRQLLTLVGAGGRNSQDHRQFCLHGCLFSTHDLSMMGASRTI